MHDLKRRMLQVLQAQNQEVVSPSDRSKLHPLVIPLAVRQPSNDQSEPVYTCLLRQVTLSSAREQVNGYNLGSHCVTALSKHQQSAPAGHACGPNVTRVPTCEIGSSPHTRVLAQVSLQASQAL